MRQLKNYQKVSTNRESASLTSICRKSVAKDLITVEESGASLSASAGDRVALEKLTRPIWCFRCIPAKQYKKPRFEFARLD